MPDSRTVRNLTIVVWSIAALVLVGLAFVRAPQAQDVSTVTNNSAVLAGAIPVVYEFSTDT
jgi:hypothetical protein